MLRRRFLPLLWAGALLSACPVPVLPAAEPPTYTIDTVAGNGRKELGPASGTVAEVNIGQTFGVEIGPDGGLYVTEVENHRVLRLDRQAGTVKVVAGNGTKGYSGDGGPATEAALKEPYEVRFAADGTMYFVEMVGAVIRKVDPKTGVITTLAGTGKPGYGGDGGPATAAQFTQPHSIALDGKGGLYVADLGNHRVRKIDLATGRIETICGTGKPGATVGGGPAKDQPVRSPRALYVTDRTLWLVLREGNSIWSIDLDSGILKFVAGTGKTGRQDGPLAEATFNGPKGIAVGKNRALYVVDTENQTIRKVDLMTNLVSTIAGTGPKGRGFGGDGGPALAAKMDRPHGICIDTDGTLYVGDTNNHRVRVLKP